MKLKVTVAGKNNPVLWIDQVIGERYGGISPRDVRDALVDVPDTQEIDVRIHTDGGSFPDSIAIHSILSRRKGGYNSIVDGKAYSGGSVIAVGGKKITMHSGSWMMIHEAHGDMGGTADDFRAAAERLDAINDQLVAIYAPRWKGTEDELRSALHAETWMRDEEAVAFGLADGVDGTLAVAAYVDPAKYGYRNVPEAVLQAKSDEDALKERVLTVEAEFPWLNEEIGAGA